MRLKTLCYTTLFRPFRAVSFDIFDTLLERDAATPTEVFVRVGDKVLGPGAGEKFRLERMDAEREARTRVENGECTLDGIYDVLSERGYDAKTAEALKVEEVRSELDGCFVKASMKPVFDSAVKQGKLVFLVSDMYLPKEVISGMVARCGYEGYEDLFVSNDIGVSKRSGKLFGRVLDAYGLNRKDLVHVGDSIGADLLGARKAGVFALPVGRKNRLGRLWKR